MSAREVSDYYLAAAFRYIKANPTEWLRLMGRKWLLVWNAYEAPDTEDYYLYKEWSGMLRRMDGILHFGVLCPLGLAGLVLTIRRYRALWVLYAWLIVTAIGVAAFVVFARYRLPLVPVLAMFAGAGLIELVSTIRAGSGRRAAIAAAVLIAVAIVANRPVPFSRQACAFSYTNHAVVLADGRRSDEAMREVEKALRLSPDNVDAHMVKASVLLDSRRHEEAIIHYQRAAEGDPHYAAARRGIGDALMGLGRFEEAEQTYMAALRIKPGDAAALTGLATAAARQGKFADAIERFRGVIATAPDHAEAHLNLGNTYAAMNRPQEAAAAYEQALRCRPVYADALYNLGVLEVRRGWLETAAGRFRRVLELQPDHAAARESLTALGETGAGDPR
jgi:tetratricopeptide (TPR) repeat protein